MKLRAAALVVPAALVALVVACRPPRPAAPPDAAASLPRARLVGRHDLRDPRGPRCAYAACGFAVRFSGTRLVARLGDAPHEGPDAPPDPGDVLAIAIDGGAPRSVRLAPGERDVVLAEGLPPGEHAALVRKRTEPSVGAVQLLGLATDGALLAPPAPTGRRLLVVGDSYATGYGVLGAGPTCGFSAATEDALASWAGLLADGLGAEASIVALHGRGVVENYRRDDPVTMRAYYTRALPFDPTSTAREPAADAVVVLLGTNDFAPDKDDPPSEEAFGAALADLLARVRENAPRATIVVTADPAAHRHRAPLYGGVAAAVRARRAAGDDRVLAHELPRATKADLTGCDFHPGPALHARIAESLLPLVRAHLP